MSGRIFTIGHGTWTLDSMVTLLRASGVQTLVDVRTSPYSKVQAEFDRPALERASSRKGFEYVYMGDSLGGRPPHADCYTEGQVDYGKVRQRDFFKKGLARLVEGYNQGSTVCLLCAEGQPDNCHRSKLLSEALADIGIPVSHFYADGPPRPHVRLWEEAASRQQALL